MKKITGCSIIAVLAILYCSRASFRPIALSGPWYMLTDPEKTGIEKEWYRKTPALQEMKLIENAGYWESQIGSDYDGWGWYFMVFSYDQRHKNVALSFSSVDDAAQVWLNAESVGDHNGANRSFKLDVSRQIKSGENQLVILVEDTGGPGGLNGQAELISYKKKEELSRGAYAGATTPDHPLWAKNAVIYELNTRQFTPEGSFRAIEPRLEELKNLGVSIIWFMPIHPIGEIHRKGSLGSYYSVKDYYGINAEFGELNDFKHLVRMIHEEEMYVIIDLVANHTAWDNPLLTKHPEWYSKNEDGKIISPNDDWHDVADLNYENKDLWQYMIAMMKYWVREIDIDGYRCDVAAMVPTEFWIQARKELDAIKPVFMLAEAETPELNAFAFDMTYAGAMHRLFNEIARGSRSPADIDDELRIERDNYPEGSMRMRFTSNHDENSWNGSAVTRMGRGGAKVGAVLTFTLPGTPLIYNGQEVGNEKALAFYERDPIIWQENEFREFYQKLARTYHQHPALHRGSIKKLKSANDDQIYAFVRKEGKDEFVVMTNFSADPFDGLIRVEGIHGIFRELFSGTRIELSGESASFVLNPWEYRIYSKE